MENALGLKKEYNELAEDIEQKIRYSEDMNEYFPVLIEDLKLIFNCEAVTVFAIDSVNHQLYSNNPVSNKSSEVRLDISLTNLPGFVAGTGNPLNIVDVTDAEELAQYHPQLSHDLNWDDILDINIQSIIVVPLACKNKLIGIVSIINKINDGHFSFNEFQLANTLSPILGLALDRFTQEAGEQDEPVAEKTFPSSLETQNADKDDEPEKDPKPHSSSDTPIDNDHSDEVQDDLKTHNPPQHPFEEDVLQEIPSVIRAVKKEPDQNLSAPLDSLSSAPFARENLEDRSPQNAVTAIEIDEVEDLTGRATDKAGNMEIFAIEKFQDLLDTIRNAKDLQAAFCDCQDSLLNIFNAENWILYEFDPAKGRLYPYLNSGNQLPEFDLPFSPESIAGYVALDKNPVNIANVNDLDEVRRYHPELHFNPVWNKYFDNRVHELLTVPVIHDEKLLGIIQLINKKYEKPFTDNDVRHAGDLAKTIAWAFINLKEPASEKKTEFSYLLKNNLITEKALTSLLAHANDKQLEIEYVLLQQGKIKREHLGLSLANFYSLPYYGYNSSIVLPQKIIGGLNKKFLAKNFWMPIQSDDSKVVILINDPTNPHRLQNIKHIFSRKQIEFKVGLKVDILDFLNSILEQGEAHFEGMKTERMSNLIDNLKEKTEQELSVAEDRDQLEEIQTPKDTDSAIIQLVNKILIDAYEREASDIHIEPGIGKENMLVRFRKEGECYSYEEIPAIYNHGIISRIKIMARLDISEKRLPQDGKFAARYGNKQVEFRVATCPTVGGNEDAVLRILAQSKMSPLEEMNFTARNLDVIKNTITKPYGLILVVGPTGSGKTTTLHSCLNFINNPKKKIWTAEDPVEITQKGLRQVQMLDKKGLNFARAMRSFLRGDPDVIMVGEMRDQETANIGLEASLTGHLVFSTLHTNSAPETITRLLDMGMNPLNFADSLLLIIAQRLVKTLCKKCKEDYHPSREEFDILVNDYGEERFQELNIEYNDALTFKKPVGCQACENTGYSGRTAIHELLEGTQAINRLIVKQATVEQIREKALQEGMTTLKQDGIQKVINGDCDLKQVLSVCII